MDKNAVVTTTAEIDRLRSSMELRLRRAAHPQTRMEIENEYSAAITKWQARRMLVLLDQGSLDLPVDAVRQIEAKAR